MFLPTDKQQASLFTFSSKYIDKALTTSIQNDACIILMQTCLLNVVKTDD